MNAYDSPLPKSAQTAGSLVVWNVTFVGVVSMCFKNHKHYYILLYIYIYVYTLFFPPASVRCQRPA